MGFFKSEYIILTTIAFVILGFGQSPSVLGGDNYKKREKLGDNGKIVQIEKCSYNYCCVVYLLCPNGYLVWTLNNEIIDQLGVLYPNDSAKISKIDSLKTIGFKGTATHYLQFMFFNLIDELGVMEDHSTFVTHHDVLLSVLRAACNSAGWKEPGVKFCYSLVNSIDNLCTSTSHIQNEMDWCNRTGKYEVASLSDAGSSKSHKKSKKKQNEEEFIEYSEAEREKINAEIRKKIKSENEENLEKCLGIMNTNGYIYSNGNHNLIYAILKYPLIYRQTLKDSNINLNTAKKFLNYLSSSAFLKDMKKSGATNGLISKYEEYINNFINEKSRARGIPPSIDVWCCTEEIKKAGFSEQVGNSGLLGMSSRHNIDDGVEFPHDYPTVIQQYEGSCDKIHKNDKAKQYCKYLKELLDKIKKNKNNAFITKSPIAWCISN